MIHKRIDQSELNSERRFECGLGPSLPDGDKWVYATEYGLHNMIDCPGCGGGKQQQIGVPASSLMGNAARHHEDPEGWDRWCAFSEGYGI